MKYKSSNIGTDRAGFLGGREGGAHILRGRTLIRISCSGRIEKRTYTR